jgi:hypothetical protein
MTIPDPYRYKPGYVSAGEAAASVFISSAAGWDVDCNGVTATFIRTGSVDDKGNVRTVGATVINEME